MFDVVVSNSLIYHTRFSEGENFNQAIAIELFIGALILTLMDSNNYSCYSQTNKLQR